MPIDSGESVYRGKQAQDQRLQIALMHKRSQPKMVAVQNVTGCVGTSAESPSRAFAERELPLLQLASGRDHAGFRNVRSAMNLRLVLLVTLGCGPLLQAQTPASKSDDPSAALHRFFAEEWEYALNESPTQPSMLGDRRANDRWDDISEQRNKGNRRCDEQ